MHVTSGHPESILAATTAVAAAAVLDFRKRQTKQIEEEVRRRISK